MRREKRQVTFEDKIQKFLKDSKVKLRETEREHTKSDRKKKKLQNNEHRKQSMKKFK